MGKGPTFEHTASSSSLRSTSATRDRPQGYKKTEIQPDRCTLLLSLETGFALFVFRSAPCSSLQESASGGRRERYFGRRLESPCASSPLCLERIR